MTGTAPADAVAGVSLQAGDEWPFPYSREEACVPTTAMRTNKFWPASARIDNVWGDRNLVCSCPPLEDYLEVDV